MPCEKKTKTECNAFASHWKASCKINHVATWWNICKRSPIFKKKIMSFMRWKQISKHPPVLIYSKPRKSNTNIEHVYYRVTSPFILTTPCELLGTEKTKRWVSQPFAASSPASALWINVFTMKIRLFKSMFGRIPLHIFPSGLPFPDSLIGPVCQNHGQIQHASWWSCCL